MIEGFSRELSEDRMAEALMEAHRYVRELCDLQQELIDKSARKRWNNVRGKQRDLRSPPIDLLRSAQVG